MQYVYVIEADGRVKQIGGVMPDDCTVITSATLPFCKGREGYESALMYNKEKGVHWEYTPLPPSEMRERAYSEYKCIKYNGKWITVDEANHLWWIYKAENNSRADELTELISAAKTHIRERYPDESEE